MTVKAKITLNDKTTITRFFPDFIELSDWMERHHGQYKGVSADTVKTQDMRQGRDKDA